MEYALILYEAQGVPFPLVRLTEKVLGTSKTANLEQFDGKFDFCETAVLLAAVHGGALSQETVQWIDRFSEEFGKRKTALILLESARNSAKPALCDAAEKWGGAFFFYDNLLFSPLQRGNHISQGVAQKLIAWKRRLKDTCDMPAAELQKAVDALLQAHNTCTLCTGFGTHLRATPIEYTYANSALYFLTEGGEKFASLAANPHASAAVYTEYSGMGELESVQLEGIAVEIEAFSPEYLEIIGKKGYSAANLKTMPLTLHMLKLEPERCEILKSKFKNKGHSVRQTFNPKDLENVLKASQKSN